MSATGLFLFGVIGAGILAAVAVFLVAYRRGPSDGPVGVGELDPKAVKADREARKQREAAQAEAGAVATLEKTEVEPEEEEGPPPVDPALQRDEVTATEYGITRRKFFNRAVLAVFGPGSSPTSSQRSPPAAPVTSNPSLSRLRSPGSPRFRLPLSKAARSRAHRSWLPAERTTAWG